MSDTTKTTTAASQDDSGEVKYITPDKIRYSDRGRVPPLTKYREETVLRYRVRMLTTDEACKRLGIKRTAFYAMLHKYYGFSKNERKFRLCRDDVTKNVDDVIRKMHSEECVAVGALLNRLGVMPDDKDWASIMNGDVSLGSMTNNDMMVLDRDVRASALEHIYKMGYEAAKEGREESFSGKEWLKKSAANFTSSDPVASVLLSKLHADVKARKAAREK